MSRNDTEMSEALDLERRWDELNVADPTVRRLDRGDQELRELAELDPSEPPRLEFVAGLWSELRDEARRIGPVDHSARELPVRPLEPVRPVARMRGMSGANKAASLLLAASLLVGMVVALLRYPFTNQGGTGGPTVVAPGPQIPDVPMPGADPARTNIQPGPGLTTLPEIKQKADVVGTSMALADNVLVVVTDSTVSAFDANTLTELWSRKSGGYTAPTMANGVIYFGFGAWSEVANPRYDPNDNLLIAMSLVDGRELWRVTGAGVYSASPIVLDGVVYSLGATSQQYNVGAYQASDGTQLWRTDVAARGSCCPDIGIALANGKLAVSLSDGIMPSLKKSDDPGEVAYVVGTTNPHTVGVFDATDGSRLWLDSDPNGGTVGEPVIVGDLLIINEAKELWSGPPDGKLVLDGGATTAYDLATGAVRWSNDAARSHRLPVASVAESSAVLYAGPWQDSDGGQLALLSLENGQPRWNVPQPQVPGDTNVYAPSDVPPVIIGDTAYAVGSTGMTPGGAVQSSLLSAIDLRTGDVQWMAQIDGGIVSEPIVSGGHIYALTHDAGLYVLGDSTTPVATPGAVVDLRTPVVCTAAPSDSPMLGDMPATPTIPEVAPWKQPIPFSSILSGVASNVDAATAQQLEALFNEYRACSAVDPYHGVFGFFSTDFYVRLKSVQVYWGEPEQPWAVWMASMSEYLTLDTNSLQQLPDGRIGGLINSPAMNLYVWFVQEDGQWKIDEYHRIWPDQATPAAGTPVPSPSVEGTPAANTGSGWPFGAGGGGDFTIAAGSDPLRIWLARIELPGGASVTIQPNAVETFVIARGTASIINAGQGGSGQLIPAGSSGQLASDVQTTVSNRGEEPVTISVLVIGTRQAFTDVTGGAEVVMLVDAEVDSLPAGAARMHYEALHSAPNVPVIVDTSRDGVALLVVDNGTFAVTRDGGAWQFGSTGSPRPDESAPDGFANSGQVDLDPGSYILITSGAAFHGSAANGEPVAYFLLTIAVNSAVVQEVESHTGDGTPGANP